MRGEKDFSIHGRLIDPIKASELLEKVRAIWQVSLALGLEVSSGSRAFGDGEARANVSRLGRNGRDAPLAVKLLSSYVR